MTGGHVSGHYWEESACFPALTSLLSPTIMLSKCDMHNIYVTAPVNALSLSSFTTSSPDLMLHLYIYI